METTVSRLPNWARWLLLLPASMLSGLVAGFLIYTTWSAQAARPDAPIVFIAQFAAGLISIFAALYVANSIAPNHKSMVVTSFALLELIAVVLAIQPALSDRDVPTLALFAGNIAGCAVGWFQLVHKKRGTGAAASA